MKKNIAISLIFILLFSLTACSQGNENEIQNQTDEVMQQSEDSQTATESKSNEEQNVLVAYFGRLGNTVFPADVDATTSASLVLGKDDNLQGTTEYVASYIQENIGGDLHLIQTTVPYPADYDATADQNHQEQEDDTLPELASTVENMEQYDVIFIGYPIWATTLPQPVVSFLSQYDLTGKTIIPFCTHAGYGSGNSYEEIQELCPDAVVLDGLALEAEGIDSSAEEIQSWLADLQLTTDKSALSAETEVVHITVDGSEITAELNNSKAAQEFASMLPLTVSMTRMGEHEYYGGLDTPLSHTEDLQTGYTVGDLAFWTPGDLFAIYFDEPEDDPEGLMILGHIISDMSVFDTMNASVEMEITLAE